MESTTKVKELKDDATMNVLVNKTFYMMAKSSLITIFKELNNTSKDYIKNITSKSYADLNDKERIFYTLTLLIGEIEKQALNNNMFVEKDIDTAALKKSLEKINKSNED